MRIDFTTVYFCAVSYIETYFDNKKLSNASGFFWSHGGRHFLISNWHVLSGRNHINKEPISKYACIPNRISFSALKLTPANENGTQNLYFNPIEAPLLDGTEKHSLWLEHHEYGSRVDIGALDVTDLIAGYHIVPANELEDDAVLDCYVSQDVFIIGYPFGRLSGDTYPIWKRGTFARDPSSDFDNLPKMLVDTATREGMSGSVVLARRSMVHRDAYMTRSGQTRGYSYISGRLDVVVGIYSGRHHADFERAQLGIVWKRRIIEEVVASGRPIVF
jgi:hypothetical protein